MVSSALRCFSWLGDSRRWLSLFLAVAVAAAEETDCIRLIDHHCPKEAFPNGTRLCVDANGWRVSSCKLKVLGTGVIEAVGVPSVAIITVERGREFEMKGSFTMLCRECVKLGKCVRAIYAMDALVTISGSLHLHGFCAPSEASADGLEDRSGPVSIEAPRGLYLREVDGGAIVAKDFQVNWGGEVVIRNTTSPAGAGGAVAASQLIGMGRMVFEDTVARGSGGAIALRLRSRETVAITFSWHMSCDGQVEPPINSIAVSPDNQFLIVSANCCPTRVFAVSKRMGGNAVWQSPFNPHGEIDCRSVEEAVSWSRNASMNKDGSTSSHESKFVIFRRDHITIYPWILPDGDVPGPNMGYDFTGVGGVSYLLSDVDPEIKGKPLLTFDSGQDGVDLLAWATGKHFGVFSLASGTQVKVVTMTHSIVSISWCSGKMNSTAAIIDETGTLFLFDTLGMTVPQRFDSTQVMSLGDKRPFQIKRISCSPQASRSSVRTTCALYGIFELSVEKQGLDVASWVEISIAQGLVGEADNPYTFVAKKPFSTGKNITAMAWEPLDVFAPEIISGEDDHINLFAWVTKEEGFTRVWVINKGTGETKVRLKLRGEVSMLRFLKSELEGDASVMVATDYGAVHLLNLMSDSGKIVRDETTFLLATKMEFRNTRSLRGQGGAIFVCQSSMVEIAHVIFSSTTALTRGAALMVAGCRGTVSLEDITIEKDVTCTLGSHNLATFEDIGGLIMTRVSVNADPGSIVVRYSPEVEFNNTCAQDAYFRNIMETTRCPLGMMLHRQKFRVADGDGCYLLCKECDQGYIYSPVDYTCKRCPFGALCELRADLRNLTVKSGAVKEVVDGHECKDGDKAFPNGVNAVFVWTGTYAKRNCTKISCKKEDAELDKSGCRDCKEYGQDYLGSKNSLCRQLPAGVANVTHEYDKGIWTIKGQAEFPGKLRCRICPTQDQVAWFRMTGTRMPPTTACLEKNATYLPSPCHPCKWKADMGILHHGNKYNYTCTFVLENGTEFSEEFAPFRTRWSLLGWVADSDTMLAACAAISSVGLIYSVCRGGGHVKKGKPVMFLTSCALLTWHAILGFTATMTEDDLVSRTPVWGQLSVGLGGLVLGLVSFMYRRWEKADRTKKEDIANDITEALRIVSDVQFPLVLARGDVFLAQDRLKCHEDMRQRRLLYFLDTVKIAKEFLSDTTDCSAGRFSVFFSHQWTANLDPDPTIVQFKAMCEALKQLAAREQRDVSTMFVWADYFSIPQANRQIQKLAINSLPIYASLLHAFVVVAPRCMHSDTGVRCDRESYQTRGWCRAEQLCHYVSRGTKGMFLADGSSCRPLDGMLHTEVKRSGSNSPHNKSMTDTHSEDVARLSSTQELEISFARSLYMFAPESQYTCCRKGHRFEGKRVPCDRQALRLPMLGLYAEIYRRRKRSDFKDIYDDIQSERDMIFPPTFTYVTDDGKQKECRLFGDLLEHLEFKLAGLPAPDDDEMEPINRADWKQKPTIRRSGVKRFGTKAFTRRFTAGSEDDVHINYDEFGELPQVHEEDEHVVGSVSTMRSLYNKAARIASSASARVESSASSRTVAALSSSVAVSSSPAASSGRRSSAAPRSILPSDIGAALAANSSAPSQGRERLISFQPGSAEVIDIQSSLDTVPSSMHRSAQPLTENDRDATESRPGLVIQATRSLGSAAQPSRSNFTRRSLPMPATAFV